MNFKTTAILLVLLIGIGGYVLFSHDKGTSSDTTTPPTPPPTAPVLDVKSTDVTGITVDGSDGKPLVTAEKTNGTWRLTVPVRAAADAGNVESLVNAVTTDLKPTSLVKATGPDAPQTGVDHPQYTVELSAAGKTTKLLVGDRLGVGDGVYAQAAGSDAVAVVPAYLLDTLGRPASDLRNKQLFGLTTASDVQQLTITHHDGSKLELQKLAGTWKIVAPAPMPADASAVDALLTTLIGLTPDSFVDDAGAPIGLGRPQEVISFSTVAPATRPTTGPASTEPAHTVVTFGSYDGVQKANVFASLADGTTFKVPASTLDALNKSPLDLRDKSVVDVDPTKVTKLTIAVETVATAQPTTKPAVIKTVVLTRRPPKPVVMGPMKPTTKATTGPASVPTTAPAPQTVWMVDGVDADDAKVTALLAQFHPLKADKFLPASAITHPARRFTVTFTTAVGSAPVVVGLDDPGHDLPLVGAADGATFNLATGNTLATDLGAGFKKATTP